MALETFLLWHDSYMQAEVFFFHPSSLNKASEFTISNGTQKSVTEDHKI